MMKQSGFTLIELMIVIAIIAILSAIAYPSYQRYVERTDRVDVQSEMMQIAQNLQRHYITHRNYTDATLSGGKTTQPFPVSGAAKYNLNLVVNADGQRWDLTAEPVIAEYGVVLLNSSGHQCWTRSKTDCTLTKNSTWTKQ